jgi:hypothetical protein
MLCFHIAQAQLHLEHHSSIGENYRVLTFPLAQAQTYLKQHHSIVKESLCMIAFPLAQA